MMLKWKWKLFFGIFLQTALTTPSASAAGEWRAKISRCAKHNVQRCEIVFSRPFERQDPSIGFELFRGATLVYSANGARASNTKRHSHLSSIIAEGRWHVSPAQRRKILNDSLLLTYVQKKSQELDDFNKDNYLLTGNSDDQKSMKSETQRTGREKSEDLDTESNHISETSPSHLERLERWASRTDGNDAPRINITTRIGTPNSPSAMLGASIDTFFVSHVLPITLSAGEYDSLRFVEGKYGRLNYHTQSLGSGLLIGKSWTRLKIGANYTEIRARFRPSQSAEKDAYIAAKRTYSGLTPHLGLYGISSGEVSYAVDYGFFLPLDTSYSKDPGAPSRSNSQPLQFRNRRQFFSFGLGLAF